LFFGKVFHQNSAYVSPLAGLKIIIRLTQGFAALTLGFYVAGPLGRQYDIRQRGVYTASAHCKTLHINKISVYSVHSVVKKQPKTKFRTTIRQLLVFWERFSASQHFCAASPRLKLGGHFRPRFRFRFTWGYSWFHLYEVGVALRSFWPSGRRLEVFLHAVRLFRLNSQKTIGQIANPHAILSRRTTTIHKNFRVFRVFSGYNNNP
jgi:hypothetical protein